MTEAFYSFIDSSGQKGSCRVFISDDDDEISFLERVKYDITLCIINGCRILHIEVI